MWRLVFCALLLASTAAAQQPPDPDYVPPDPVLIEDNFSEPSSIAERWQVTAGSWSGASGTYASTAGATSISTIRRYPVIEPGQQPLPQLLYDVYTYRARLRNPGSGANQWVGLVYQMKDPQNYSEVVFSPTGVMAVREVANGGAPQTIFDATYEGGGTGIWFDVALHRNENHGWTSVEVNGVPIVVNFGQGGADGKLGLVSHGVAGRFDKVRLSMLLGERPFKDSFTDPNAVSDWAPQSGQWVKRDGIYTNTAVQANSYTQHVIDIGPDSFRTRTFSLRARMFNPLSGAGNLVGILFHRESPFDYAEVVFSPTGVAQLNRVRGFTKQTLATASYAGRPRTWFDVKLQVVELNTISVTVDGKPVFDGVSTGDKIAGRFGLVTHWAPGSFDDVWYDQRVFTPFAESFASPPPSSWIRSGQWDANGGTLNSTAVGGTDVVATECGCWDTDFRYSARLLNEFRASGNLVGLVYNYHSKGLYAGDYYEVVFSATGIARLNKVIQGVRYLVASASHNVPQNAWFDVQVVRSGLNTTVLVNGNPIFDNVTQGELLTSADVGVITHWSRGRFDDLVVEDFAVR
jgi:hypothetical protein